jgi:uncharacterized protein DUF2779
MNKTSFLRGRQCPLRPWLDARPEVAKTPEAEYDETAVFEPFLREARQVEDLAESLFAGKPYQREADIQGGPLQARIDYLEELPDGVWVWEVKASSGVKPVHLWDLAFQCLVAERAGLNVRGAGVIHLDKNTIRGVEPLAAGEVLIQKDCWEEVESLLEAVRLEVDVQLKTLAKETPPRFTPQGQCKASRSSKLGNRPDACPHLGLEGYCGKQLPWNWAGYLPRIGAKLQGILEKGGLTGLADKELAGLSDIQQRFVEAFRKGGWVVDQPVLRSELEAFDVYPRSFLDFEFVPACGLPPFEGMRPNQKLPFQWSLGIQNERGGKLQIHNFVHPDPSTDPRRELIENLREVLPRVGPVIVHSRGAESSVFNLYDNWFGGEYWEFAESVRDRLEDTCAIAQQTLAHPDLHGSFSLKKLAPVLVGQGYDDLAIQNGMLAVTEWQKLERMNGSEKDAQLESLTAYCQRDAELMLGLLNSYSELASGGKTN